MQRRVFVQGAAAWLASGAGCGLAANGATQNTAAHRTETLAPLAWRKPQLIVESANLTAYEACLMLGPVSAVFETVTVEPVYGLETQYSRGFAADALRVRLPIDSAVDVLGDFYCGANTGQTLSNHWQHFGLQIQAALTTHYQTEGGTGDLIDFNIMSTGNHEAYAVPYGISPRVQINPAGWASTLHKLEEKGDTAALAKHRQKREAASEFFTSKANDGIPADHNLTIYEATLIYGPTYAQAYTTQNHQSANYSWFSAAFNPLESYTLALGANTDQPDAPAIQALTVLGWGQTERYLSGLSNAGKVGADQRGVAYLPYASGAMDERQLALLQTAKAHKRAGAASSVLATHFTVMNYDPVHSLQEAGGFVAADDIDTSPLTVRAHAAQYNSFNHGSAELGVKSYLREHTNQALGVDWHLSGHSHRAQVFTLTGTDSGEIRTEPKGAWHGFDPGVGAGVEAGVKLAKARAGITHFIVSSSGGPLGIQNMAGELDGWTLRPPSGSLLNTQTSSIKQIKTKAARTIPRLCVALDYVVIGGRGKGLLTGDNELSAHAKSKDAHTFNPKLTLSITGKLAERTDCLDFKKITLWVFSGADAKIGAADGYSASGASGAKFISIPCTSDGKNLVIQDVAALQAALGKEVKSQCAFLSIGLTLPNTAWAKDMSAEDPWFFPVKVGIETRSAAGLFGGAVYNSYIRRPRGELGEVPNWDFWSLRYPSIYPTASAAIKGAATIAK